MHLNDRVTYLTKRIGGMFATLLAAVLVAAFGAALAPGVASAAPGENIDGSLVQASVDGTTGWTPMQSFPTPWDTSKIAPGVAGENRTTFYVKNASTVAVDAQFYLGEWSISAGSAYFAVEVDGVRSAVKTLSSNGPDAPGILVEDTPLGAGGIAKVTLVVGLPASEQTQDATIEPAWGISMEQTSADIVAPAAPTGVAVSPNPATVGDDVTVTGQAVAGSTVKVTVGGVERDATVDGSGNFTVTFKPATAGTVSITAKATKGGLSSPASSAVSLTVKDPVVDPTAPAAPTNVAVNPNPATVGDQVTATGKAEAGSTVKVTVGGVEHDATVDGSGNFSYVFQPTAAGTLSVTAKATKDGLTSAASAPASLTVKDPVVDPTAPAAPTNVAVNPNPATVGDQVTVTGKAEAGSTVKVTVGTVVSDVAVDNDGNFTFTFIVGTAGTVNVTATATKGGMTGAPSAPVALTATPADGVDPGTGSAGSLGSLNLGSLNLGSLTSIFGSAASTPASAPASAPFTGSLGAPAVFS